MVKSCGFTIAGGVLCFCTFRDVIVDEHLEFLRLLELVLSILCSLRISGVVCDLILSSKLAGFGRISLEGGATVIIGWLDACLV